MNNSTQALRDRIKGKRILNFKNTDFIYPNYKDTIQDILREEYFPDFDINGLPVLFQANKFESLLTDLKSKYPISYQNLFKQTVGGNFGPGELLSYFVTKNGTLSGRSSTGDLKVGSAVVEIKSVRLDSTGSAYDVRTGSTPDQVTTNKIYSSLKELANKHKLQTTGDIQASIISQLRKIAGGELQEIEDMYTKAITEQYFNKFNVVFFNDTTGEVINVFSPRSIQSSKIELYRFSQKQFSCRVKIR